MKRRPVDPNVCLLSGALTLHDLLPHLPGLWPQSLQDHPQVNSSLMTLQLPHVTFIRRVLVQYSGNNCFSTVTWPAISTPFSHIIQTSTSTSVTKKLRYESNPVNQLTGWEACVPFKIRAPYLFLLSLQFLHPDFTGLGSRCSLCSQPCLSLMTQIKEIITDNW